MEEVTPDPASDVCPPCKNPSAASGGGELDTGHACITDIRTAFVDFVVVDLLDTITKEQAEIKQKVTDALASIRDLKQRVDSIEDHTSCLYQKLNCHQALALFVLPAIFAYIFESMMGPEDIQPYGRHPYGLEPKFLFMAFRGVCLAFSMCVGLPMLMEEIRLYCHHNSEIRQESVPTQTNLGQDDESMEAYLGRSMETSGREALNGYDSSTEETDSDDRPE